MKMRVTIGWTLAMLTLCAAAPAATAKLGPCGPPVVCAEYAPYAGSVYCQQPGTSGVGHASVSTEGLVKARVDVQYGCVNAGGGPRRESSAIVYEEGLLAPWIKAGWRGTSSASGNHCGPVFEDPDIVFLYEMEEICLLGDAAGTILAPVFTTVVTADGDCTSNQAPTIEVCERGHPTGYLAAVTLCSGENGTSYFRIAGAQSQYRDSLSCIVFWDLLGP